MKKLIPFLILFCLPAMASQTLIQGINVLGWGGEPAIQANNNNQTTDWLQFKSNGIPVFAVPSTGILPVAYGGTGSNSVNNLVSYSYNTTFVTNALGDTNHIYALNFGTSLGITNVNIVYTRLFANYWRGTNGTVIYSNSIIGAWAMSNSFGDLLYTNSAVASPTNGSWSVGIGASPASAVTNEDQILTNYSAFTVYSTNNPANGDFAPPAIGQVKFATSNYDTWCITAFATNRVVVGR